MESVTVLSATYEADFAINFKLVVDDETIPHIFRIGAEYTSPLDNFLHEWYLTHQADVAPWVDPGPEPARPYSISKMTPWDRMTEEEAELMENFMDSASAKMRQTYNAAQYLESSHPLFSYLLQVMAQTLPGGETRANELLAPEN